MQIDLATVEHFCGDGASVVLDGNQLRLQPSEAGTACVETRVELQPNTHYQLCGRIASEDGCSWGHVGVKNFDARGGQKENGSHAHDASIIVVDFCTNCACTVVLYAHAWKQQSAAVLVDSLSLSRLDGEPMSAERPAGIAQASGTDAEIPSAVPIGPSIEHEGYLALNKALYVWNPGGKDLGISWGEWTAARISRLVLFCISHNFSRVIVFIGSIEWEWEAYFSQHRLPHEKYFAQLFAALRQQGVGTNCAFYLNDDVNNLVNYHRAADVVSSVVEFNKRYPQSVIDGIEGDQEPATVTDDYLAMNKSLSDRLDSLRSEQAAQTLDIGASIKPAWLSSNSVRSVMQMLSSVMIMAYSSDPQTTHTLASAALSHASTVSCKVSMAIETSFRAPTSDSYWDLLTTDPSAFFDAVVKMDELGRRDSQYNDFVIHDYEGYFKALHGVDPIDMHTETK